MTEENTIVAPDEASISAPVSAGTSLDGSEPSPDVSIVDEPVVNAKSEEISVSASEPILDGKQEEVSVSAGPTPDGKKEVLQKNFMRPRRFDGGKREPQEFEEQVIEVRRIARTVKGGRRIRFRALVVIGNKKGKVGMGLAKSTDVADAVRKAVARAKKNIVIVPIINGTIPYEIYAKHGSAVVMLRPAATGTSIVAGGAIRAVAELAGITDLLSKIMGSQSKVNNVVATMKAFEMFNPSYVEKIKRMVENNLEKSVAVAEVIAETKEPSVSARPSLEGKAEILKEKKEEKKVTTKKTVSVSARKSILDGKKTTKK